MVDWLGREGLSIVWLSKRLGVHAPVISRWIHGHAVPHLWYVQQIDTLTSGEVGVHDWPIKPPRKTSQSIAVKPYKRPTPPDEEPDL